MFKKYKPTSTTSTLFNQFIKKKLTSINALSFIAVLFFYFTKKHLKNNI